MRIILFQENERSVVRAFLDDVAGEIGYGSAGGWPRDMYIVWKGE